MEKNLPVEMCCGCTACKSVCRFQAIMIEQDEKGFEHPIIDRNKCIDCGMCLKTCPVLNEYFENRIQHVYAAKSLNEDVRSKSTSGGIARVIIDSYLEKNPNSKVYGSIMKENLVYHYGTDKKDELDWFYGSKYVASKFDGILNEIIDDLERGRDVLFFGTPCQAAGMKRAIPVKYRSHFLIVDVICHGPGSPELWEKYLGFIESNEKSNVIKYLFRDKRGGWRRYSIYAKLKNGKELRDTAALRTWSVLFFKGLIQRESCFSCKFSTEYRYSDITIGDFWGLEKVDKAMVDEGGMSIVTTNSYEGEMFLKSINPQKAIFKEEQYEAINTQANLCGGRKKPLNYEKFWAEYSCGFPFLAVKYGEYNFKGKIKAVIKRILRFFLLYK